MNDKFTNDGASCNVLPSKALPAGAFELSSLFTVADKRGQGYATSLMKLVCGEADIEGCVLVLSPTDDKLQAFYKRFGFTEIQPRPVLMARQPQQFKVKFSMVNNAVMSSING
jgi:GNAT superfamily N-acetyltransferase